MSVFAMINKHNTKKLVVARYLLCHLESSMKNFLSYLTSLCCLVEILTWESKQQESSKSELNRIIVAFVENFFYVRGQSAIMGQ